MVNQGSIINDVPDGYINAQDAGILPNTDKDLSQAILNLLKESNTSHKGIYFPAGTYLFASDVLLTSYNSLLGSAEGTIFRCLNPQKKSIMFGDSTYGTKVSNVNIENIIFDNIRVHFYGRKSEISISYNVFINTITEHSTAQLTCSSSFYTISGNVFIRGRNYPGVALSTYGNSSGLLIEQNFLGSVNAINLATPWLGKKTQTLLTTLLSLRDKQLISFDDAQGEFVSGWYSTSNLKKGIFRKNFISGSDQPFLYNPETGEDDIQRDHGVYIKQYEQVEVIQNYFSGWPKDDKPSGQLKFRNAKGLVFAGNYLNHISFNARPYDNVDDQWLIMQDTFIFNNYLSDALISYWQNFVDTENKAINIKDYLVFSNHFINRTESKPLVTSPEKSLSSNQFFCSENIFVETGKLVPTSGVITEIPIDKIQDRLPDYAKKYLSTKPIMP
ncbi:glycosyl hydrolase family 28-related protein [Providencia huaxiensis]|uniref:glycosyl hydrolase family 28-related protein n=1 Tax=Providencia huaxiensis TaxID=2027290 RepID=UPI0032DAE278